MFSAESDRIAFVCMKRLTILLVEYRRKGMRAIQRISFAIADEKEKLWLNGLHRDARETCGLCRVGLSRHFE